MSIQSSHARLLLNYHGYYGRVCLDGWDTQDARVACRQLGYSGGDVYTHVGHVIAITTQNTMTTLASHTHSY